MQKTRKSWLITGLLAIAFVFMAGFAFLGIPVNANTAYAAISDYDSAKTESESLVYGNISDSPESGSKDNWYWSGGSQKTVSDNRYFSLSAGASLTVANIDANKAPYLTHAYIRIYAYTATQLTVSVDHGSKSASTNYAASGDSETYSAELIGDRFPNVTFTITNNNANAVDIFTNLGYYYGAPVTINFSKAGGSGGSDDASANYYFPYSSINIPTKSGYKFLGYYGSDGTTQYYNANGAPTLSKFDTPTAKSSLNLTAQWEIAENTVTLNKNGGTGGTNSVVATYDQAMPSATMPTRTGYTFTGYYDKTSGGTKYYNANGTSAKNWDKMADTTLYAQWTAKTYDLTFNNGEGQGGDDGVTATYDEVLPNVSVPTLDGYTFVGYYDEENAAGSSVVGGNKYIDNAGHGCKAWDKDSAPTLYAYYTQNMVVAFDGYNAEYDRDFHTITVTPTNPTDAVVKYGTTAGTYNLTSAPTYKNVGVYTVYFEVTKAGWTTYRGSETVVISKTNAEYETLPEAIEGLIYNNEPLTLVSAASLKYSDAGNIVYRIEYTDSDTEQSYITDYSTTLPQGIFATTYTVFYKALGNSNYNPIAEDSFTVTIAQVDKEALLTLIAKVDAYHDKIAEGYADADADMMVEREISQENFIDKANVTSGQIAEQIEQLQAALSTAKIEVVTQKIEEIGNVERTKESKALIDDAKEYFDDLTEEEKAEIANAETLTKSEEKYDKLVFDFNVTVSCATIFGFLGLCLIILTILYLIAMFKKNKWIIKDGKVVRAYVCKKIVPEGRKVITAGLKKTTRPENRIYDTKEEALAALENGEPTDDVNNDTTDEDEGNRFGSIKSRSFEEKLNDLSDDLKKGYNDLKNEILAYNGTKANAGRGFEYITAGRTTLVKFAVKGKTLCVYYDLETEKLNSKYKVEKVESKKYASTPCLYRIKNNRRLNYAKELIALVAKEQGLEK